MDAIKKAERLNARRYRNRRLGDFLKELELSEGRATGIPTIQDELAANGSPKAVIETDDERSYFLIKIPVREGFDLDEFNSEPKNEFKSDTKSDAKSDTKSDAKKYWEALNENEQHRFAQIIQNCIKHQGPSRGGQWIVLIEL